MKRFTLEEIRTFFVRRNWMRPSDWTDIEAKRISSCRARELSCFISGYLCAKDGTNKVDAEALK